MKHLQNLRLKEWALNYHLRTHNKVYTIIFIWSCKKILLFKNHSHSKWMAFPWYMVDSIFWYNQRALIIMFLTILTTHIFSPPPPICKTPTPIQCLWNRDTDYDAFMNFQQQNLHHCDKIKVRQCWISLISRKTHCTKRRLNDKILDKLNRKTNIFKVEGNVRFRKNAQWCINPIPECGWKKFLDSWQHFWFLLWVILTPWSCSRSLESPPTFGGCCDGLQQISLE